MEDLTDLNDLEGHSFHLVGWDAHGYSSLDVNGEQQLLQHVDVAIDEAQRLARLPKARRHWHWQEHGDGGLLLIPASVPLQQVVGDFVRELSAALGRRNSNLRRTVQLRVAIHHGLVNVSNGRFLGPATILLGRMLAMKAVREALGAEPTADLALVISNWVYREVIRARVGFVGLRPADFRRVKVETKAHDRDIDHRAWMTVLGDRRPAVGTDADGNEPPHPTGGETLRIKAKESVIGVGPGKVVGGDDNTTTINFGGWLG